MSTKNISKETVGQLKAERIYGYLLEDTDITRKDSLKDYDRQIAVDAVHKLWSSRHDEIVRALDSEGLINQEHTASSMEDGFNMLRNSLNCLESDMMRQIEEFRKEIDTIGESLKRLK